MILQLIDRLDAEKRVKEGTRAADESSPVDPACVGVSGAVRIPRQQQGQASCAYASVQAPIFTTLSDQSVVEVRRATLKHSAAPYLSMYSLTAPFAVVLPHADFWRDVARAQQIARGGELVARCCCYYLHACMHACSSALSASLPDFVRTRLMKARPLHAVHPLVGIVAMHI